MRQVCEALAPALVVALTALVATAEVSGALGWRLLASVTGSRILLVVCLAGAVACVLLWSRTCPPGRARERVRLGWVVYVPAAVLLALLAAAQLSSTQSRVGWFLGGDNVRHLLFVAHERRQGYLSYSVESYPRAWHTFVTALWSGGGRTTGAEGLVNLIDLMTISFWCLFALLTLATSQLGRSLARRCGRGERESALAGLVAGLLTLSWSFLPNYLSLGFQNSVLAGLLLAVTAREVLDHRGRWRALLVTGCCLALMAHVWQLLAPAAALGFVAAAGWLLGAPSRTRLRWLVVSGTALAVFAVALPGAVAVLNEIGLRHGTDAGVVAPIPRVLLPCALVCAAVVTWWRRDDPRLRVFGSMVWVTAMSAVALAVVLRIPVSMYYPSKVLWSAALLGLPAVGVVAAQGIARARAASSAVRVATGAAVATFVVGTLALPTGAVRGVWASVDAPRVISAVTSPGAEQAQVVWLGGPVMDDVIARILLDYYHPVDSSGWTPQGPLTVSEECSLLMSADRPTVLTPAPERATSRYACVGTLHAVVPRPHRAASR